MGKDREEGYLTNAARGPNTAEEGVPNRKPAAVFIEEKIEELVKLIQETYQSSRERILAVTNIEQGALWLTRCDEVKLFDVGDK